jgi:hypothetical protein
MSSRLLTATKTEHQVEGGLLLDVVIRERPAVLKLLTSKDETLLVRRDTLLVLDLRLDVVNGVAGLHLQCDCLAGEGLDEDLHTTTETEHQVKSRLLLDVVVRESTAVFQLLASENETLLVWRNALLILDLGLDVVDSIRRLNLESDGLSSQCLDKDLHTTTQAQDEMQSRLLLNVVVGQGAAILELLAGEDQALLVWWDTLLVLNLALDIVDGVGRLDLECDGLAGESLDENLHTTTKAEDQVEGGLLLDVVVGQGATVFKLLAGEDQALLVWWDTLLVLNLALDIVDGVGRLDLEGDGLAGEGLDEDLHGCGCCVLVWLCGIVCAVKTARCDAVG